MFKITKGIASAAFCSGVSLFFELNVWVKDMLEYISLNIDPLALTLTLSGIAGILIAICWESFQVSSFKKSNSEYAKAVGFLYNDVFNNEKQKVISETANPSRAYNSYWKLENYLNSLPSNNNKYKKLSKFLSYFKTKSSTVHGIMIGSTIELKCNKIPKDILKTVNYLKENL